MQLQIQQSIWRQGVQSTSKGVLFYDTLSQTSIKSSSIFSTHQIPHTLHQIVASVKVQRRKHICKKQKSCKWKSEELQRLLQLLNICGTDFEMIALHMNKTRDQIKRKYILLGNNYQERVNQIFKRKVEKNVEIQKNVQQLASMSDMY